MSQDGVQALMPPGIGEVDLGPSIAEQKLAVYPTLCFWYGLSLTELLEMPGNLKTEFLDALPGLLKTYQTIHLTSAAFPHMTEKGRREVLDYFKDRPARQRLRVITEDDQPEQPARPYRKPPWPDEDGPEGPRPAQPKDMSYEQWQANLHAVGITFVPPKPKAAAGEEVAS